MALNRARRKAYLIVAADADSHSPFSDELDHNEEGRYDVGEDELAELLEPMRPLVPCPACQSGGPSTAALAVCEGASLDWVNRASTAGRLPSRRGKPPCLRPSR